MALAAAFVGEREREFKPRVMAEGVEAMRACRGLLGVLFVFIATDDEQRGGEGGGGGSGEEGREECWFNLKHLFIPHPPSRHVH